MGDNFLKQQIRNFERSTDLALDKLDTPGLIQRNEILRAGFRARPRDGEFFREGEKLYAVVASNRLEILLSRGHRHIGGIAGQSAQAIKEAMCDVGSILVVRVVSVMEVSGRATIEVFHE